LLEGEESPFNISISLGEDVDKLKKEIKAELQNALQTVDSPQLMLWKIDKRTEEAKGLVRKDIQHGQLDSQTQLSYYWPGGPSNVYGTRIVHVFIANPAGESDLQFDQSKTIFLTDPLLLNLRPVGYKYVSTFGRHPIYFWYVQLEVFITSFMKLIILQSGSVLEATPPESCMKN
jgi:hypothetical protein